MTDEELKADYIKRKGVQVIPPGHAIGYSAENSFLAGVKSAGFEAVTGAFNRFEEQPAVMARRRTDKADKAKYTPLNSHGMDSFDSFSGKGPRTGYLAGLDHIPFAQGPSNHSSKPVKTPDGVFDSAKDAAQHFGIHSKTAATFARLRKNGWSYV